MAASGTYSAHTFQPVKLEFDEPGSKALAFSTGSVTIRFMYEGVEYGHGVLGQVPIEGAEVWGGWVETSNARGNLRP